MRKSCFIAATIAAMLAAMHGAPSFSADLDCTAANAVGKKIYARAHSMVSAWREQEALTASQDFWALHEQFGKCPEISSAGMALRKAGYGPERKPDDSIVLRGGSTGAGGSGIFAVPGSDKGGASATSNIKNLVIDGIEFVPVHKLNNLKKDSRGATKLNTLKP